MPKLSVKRIILYFVALILLLVLVYAFPKIANTMTDTEILEEGTLRISDEVNCYIVRSETVYSSLKDGTIIEWKLKEGDLVKRGTPVLKFIADKKQTVTETTDDSQSSGFFGFFKKKSTKTESTISSKYVTIVENLGKDLKKDKTHNALRKGVFSFQVDGSEAYFARSNIMNITKAGARENYHSTVKLKRNTAKKGEPIYKITDNSNWFAVFWVDNTSVRKYSQGSNVYMIFGGKTKVKAKIYDITLQDNEYRIILKSNRFYEEFYTTRTTDAEILMYEGTGLIVSNSAIIVKNGQQGVYAKNTTGDYIFKRVNVLSTDGTRSLISQDAFYDTDGNSVFTVKIYDEILKNPTEEKSSAKDGEA